MASKLSPRVKVALIGVGVVVVVAASNFDRVRGLLGPHSAAAKAAESKAGPLVELADREGGLRLTAADAKPRLGLEVAEVRVGQRPEPLRLPGSLSLDPNRLIHVHARFGGEAVTIGDITTDSGTTRPLRYGDRVTRGQVLAVVWSKEIGEKKSELMDAVSRRDTSRNLLDRYEGLTQGIVPERTVQEARREYQADEIAVARAERTLRSWRMTDDEIKAIHDEIAALKADKRDSPSDPERDRRWAEIEIRAAIDGVIVEKNFNVGDIVEPTDDLFKIADLSRLQVLVNIYEEDLWALRNLGDGERRWLIDLKSDPSAAKIHGEFDLIGSLIDPAQRTGVVMGWLDNSEGKLAVGQFITAVIELPSDPNIVAIPESALIEEGDSSNVFVEVDAARREYVRRPVTVIRRNSGTVYVSAKVDGKVAEPLKSGDRVVISGVLGLNGQLAILRTQGTKRT